MTPDNRLTYDDDLFQRMRRVLGVPVVNQTVWRFDTPLDPERVERLRRRLARGPLARVVRRSRVPGARDRWIASDVAAPVHEQRCAVPPGDLLAWAERRAATDLDPERGPTWELATVPTTDGGSALSYLTSHAVCDGGGHVASLVAAAEGTDIGRLPVDDARTRWGDDVRDAGRQLVRAARGGAQAVGTSRGHGGGVESSGPHAFHPERDGDDEPWRPPTAVVDCDALEWEAAARRHGGTPNALLVAIAVEVLMASGRVPAGRPVRVALPVSLRSGADDLRSNVTSGVSIDVDTRDEDGISRAGDLATIRSRAKREFTSLADGSRHDALTPLKPLMQMLPDRAVARLARGATAPLCLCSNLGELPASFTTPVGTAATSVLMRSVTQNVTPSMMRRTRGGLNAWWSRHGSTATLAVLGLDPDHLGHRDEIAALVVEVCARWGVHARPW